MLTEEQRKIVEENHNLIYSYIKQKELDFSEYYDLLAIALCRAVIYWKQENGSKLSTYVYSVFDKEVCRDLKYKNQYKRKIEQEYLSFDFEYETIDGTYTLKDAIPSPFNLEQSVIKCMLLQQFNDSLCQLNPREQIVIHGLLKERSQVGISEELGCSKQRVNQMKNEILNKLNKNGLLDVIRQVLHDK